MKDDITDVKEEVVPEVKPGLVPVTRYTNEYLEVQLEEGQGCINLKIHIDVKDLFKKYGDDVATVDTYLPLGVFTNDNQLVLSLMDEPANVTVEDGESDDDKVMEFKK